MTLTLSLFFFPETDSKIAIHSLFSPQFSPMKREKYIFEDKVRDELFFSWAK